MTGINGKKNKTKKSIVLFDKSIAIEEIKSILKDTNSSIISLDFESFELLQKNNIDQKIYDEFLTTDEMSNIQKLSYELSLELRDKAGILASYVNFTTTYVNKGDYDKALIYCDRAMEFFEDYGKRGEVYILNSYGKIS